MRPDLARHTPPHFAAGYGAMPTGAVIAFAGKLAATPAEHVSGPIEAWGWMACDGRWLKIALYPELYAVLGHQYDDGSQQDQFRIPDYRGYFLRGADDGSGNDADSAQRKPGGSGGKLEVGSVQSDAVRNHEHGFDATGAPTVEAAGPPGTVTTKMTMDAKPLPLPQDGISAHETRPKNIYVNYLIRFTGRLPHAR